MKTFSAIFFSGALFLSVTALAQPAEGTISQDVRDIIEQADSNKDGLVADHEHMQVVRAAFSKYDWDKDGVITRLELRIFLGLNKPNGDIAAVLTEEKASEAEASIDSFFKRNDTNQDDNVSQYEHMNANRATFKAIDTNNDSFASPEEYEAYLR